MNLILFILSMILAIYISVSNESFIKGMILFLVVLPIICYIKKISLNPFALFNQIKGENSERKNPNKNVKVNHDKALKYYENAINYAPDFFHAHYRKAATLHNLARFEEAIQSIDKAIELRPKFAISYLTKSISLHYLGRHKEAIDVLNNDKIKIGKHRYLFLSFKGVISLEMGDYKGALEYSNEMIKLQPKLPEGYIIEADTHIKLGDYDSAINLITNLSSNLKRDRNLRVTLGLAYQKRNAPTDNQKANEILEELLNEKKEDIITVIACSLSRKREELMDSSRTLISLHPSYKVLLKRSSELENYRNDPEFASIIE
jgi:tetratricopeptide (TPR) repeat protein